MFSLNPTTVFNRTMHRKNMNITYENKNIAYKNVANHGLTTLVSNYTNVTSIASGMLPIFIVVSHQHHQ
jgi:hypothetical protein